MLCIVYRLSIAKKIPFGGGLTSTKLYLYVIMSIICLCCLGYCRGALKMLDVKMTDVKLTDQCAGLEIAGHENDGPNDRT